MGAPMFVIVGSPVLNAAMVIVAISAFCSTTMIPKANVGPLSIDP